MRTVGAIARLGAVALVLGILVRAALAAAWSPAQVTAALAAAIVLATALALVLLTDARRARYATAAGERDADRALAAGWPDEPVRSCRYCGCTDERACPEGCFWMGPDLCSASECLQKARADIFGVPR